jgi:ABC-2 type transport system permease protein
MTRLRTIRLVALREIAERGRTKGFWGSLLLTVGLIVAAVIVPAVIFGDEDALAVGIVEPAPVALGPALVAAGTIFETTVAVSSFADVEAAREAVASESVKGVIVVPTNGAGTPELIVKSTPDQRFQAIATAGLASARLAELATEHGIPPTDLATLATPPIVDSIEERGQVDESAILIANIGVILLFVSIFSFGYWVLSGVVEEKQSRVVEVVLSTVRPRELLIGKVLGIGILGLVQLVIMVVVGVAAARITGTFELPDTTSVMVGTTLLWYVIGYAIYATAFGVLGALASRMEDASNVTAPVSLVATGGYLIGLFGVMADPDGLVATVSTFIPPFAPMVVPFRVAVGGIGPLEFGAAVIVAIGFVWAMFLVGGRVYRGAVLQIGGQIRLRDAWRAGTR